MIDKNSLKNCFAQTTIKRVELEIQEEKKKKKKSDTVLQSGMIITIEPGIYLQDKFGVRIEDMLMVTDDGYYNFTKSKKELIIL